MESTSLNEVRGDLEGDDNYTNADKSAASPNTTKAIYVSLLCGLLNFVATSLLLVSFNHAILTNSNLAIASTMLSGCIVWGLYGSFCVYNETITVLQLIGSLMLIAGNCTLAIFS